MPATLSGVMLFLLAGCTTAGNTGLPLPTPTRAIEPGDLHFEDPETGRRFVDLDRCVRTMADASWTALPYEKHGNFLEADWCRGGNAAAGSCDVGPPWGQELDQHTVELFTLSYDLDFSEVFGLGVRSVWIPEDPGWGVGLYYAEDGRTIVGEGLGIDFTLYPRPQVGAAVEVHLGSRYEYSIDETTLDLESDLAVREDLAAYLTSPQALRDRGIAGLEALQAKVEEAIRAHEVPKCVYGPYQGGGLPPLCTPQAMSREEEEAEWAAAKTYFASQKQLLGDHYLEMYAALMQAFPLDRSRP